MKYTLFALSFLFLFSCSTDSTQEDFVDSKEANLQSIHSSSSRIPTYPTGKQHELLDSQCGLLLDYIVPVYYFNFQASPDESCTSLYIWWDMGQLMPLYNSGNYDIEITYKYKLVSNDQLITDSLDVDAYFDQWSNPNPFFLRYFPPGGTPKGIKGKILLTNRTTNCVDEFTAIKWSSPCD